MIFVTVGTHEQQFDRLVREVDHLKKIGVIQEEVFIQTGFSNYEPQYCKWEKLIAYDEMTEMINVSSIVITHGGPASFLQVLAMGKKPIVVPRLKRFSEHVNDHQLDFAKKYEQQSDSITVIETIESLKDILIKMDQDEKQVQVISNNDNFIKKLKIEIDKLLGD